VVIRVVDLDALLVKEPGDILAQADEDFAPRPSVLQTLPVLEGKERLRMGVVHWVYAKAGGQFLSARTLAPAT